MKLNNILLICITLCVLLLSISCVSATDFDSEGNQTLAMDSMEVETSSADSDIDVVQDIESSGQDVLQSSADDSKLSEGTDEIVVNDWNDLQYYCSLTDADYTLKLKENTNYYPDDVSDSNYQIIVKNNVKIIGNAGAYFGDVSPDAGNITYTAIKVNDNSGIGITMENVTFKWIGTRYQPDGVFLVMGGNASNAFTNCYFTNISTNLGHSSIVHLKRGNATITNCTFINCTTDFGCLSVYDPNDDPTGTCTGASMQVTDSYFEGNYARTEPGCINNCGILVVNNTTFYKNSAFWWAGAIHTHGGANTTIYDSDFIDNLAGWNGGALYTYSYLQIYNSRFIGNNCTTNNGGGAIGACKYLHAPYIHIEDSLFENNENLCWGLDELSTSGTGRGGAISLMDEGGLEVYNSVFIKNSASIGTAICAISGGLSYGSPDVIIVGNQFINHTRIGDVLDVRLATGSVAEIRDNYYYNNSLVYEKLKLTADDPVNGFVTFHIDASLKNPNSFDADILDKSEYNVYVNGVYSTTVSDRTFTLNLGKGNTAKVYVMPSISNSKSNEVSAGIAKTFIYVSQNSGNDANDGLTRSKSVKTLAKAIELARSTENIVIIDGTFKETNLEIDYNLTISANSNVAITVTGMGFVISDGDVKFENVTFKNSKYGSKTTNKLISQTSTGYLILEGCVFEGNEYKTHIEANVLEAENVIFNNNKDGAVIKADSLSIKSSLFTNNIVTYTGSKGLVMYKANSKMTKFEVENLTFIGNTMHSGCLLPTKASSTVTITDCTFIGNSGSTRASAVCIEGGASVIIQSSKVINNTDTGSYSAPIYVTSGTLLLKDSIILNNTFENNNGLVVNGNDANLKKVTANNNWWGNTPDNLTKPNLRVFPVSNALPNGWDPVQYWLVLNATSLSNEIELNNRIPVQFMFTQIDNEGNVTSYDGYALPEFDLVLTPVNGTCSNSKVTVTNGIATTYFTLTQMSSSSLTGTFNGISSTINFTFAKSTPDMSIDASDINVGETANIVVNVGTGVTGKVTVNVGGVTKTATISNSRATFAITNLAVGNYTIEATYTGNSMYEPFTVTKNITVNKLPSTTEISIGTVALNKDVIVTITLPSDATGTVDVYVNGVKQTINAGATYTINKVQRGDYIVKAVYSGDSKYLSSEDQVSFEVAKLTPTVTVSVPDITYGEDAVVTVTVNNGATGNVTVTIDGKSNTSAIQNSQAVVKLSGIDAGTNKYVDVTYSGCNDYKNASVTQTFNVAKANLSFTVTSSNVMLGNDAVVEIVLPARAGGSLKITGIRTETKSVPASGVVTLTYEDLTVGTYTVSAQYTGNNYVTTKKSTTFKVLDWNQPQWANEGGDIQHTGKSVYDTSVNGEIKWSASVDAITGNLAIDSEGNIYVTTTNGVSSFDNNGNLRWTYESDAAGDYFAGIAISRDIIIAPKASDTLYLINQSTGERFGHANLYQGSSCFSPVVDSYGNIYIAGQGGEGQNPNLVVIPYKIWENGGNPDVIALGGNPVGAPTLVDDGLVVVPCDNGIKIVDVYSKELISAIGGVINGGYAVADEYGIIYSFLGNSIVARDSSGSPVWSAAVTGGVGNQLFMDSEVGIYSVNANGELYRYDIFDGTESKFCDLIVTSGILIGNDNNLYLASGDFLYALDIDGNILWKAKVDGNIIGTPIMDNNGIIYVNTANKVFALMESDIKDAGLTVSADNIDIGSDETISISLNENATGAVSIVVNGQTYTEEITDGNIVKVISGLPAGTYTARVTYSGDMRYSQITKSARFTVSKLNPNMNVTVNNIKVGANAVFNVVLPSDATGTVSVTVGTKSGSGTVTNGKATISISGLTKGDYSYTVTYAGDSKYSSDSKTGNISVDKTEKTFTVAPITDVNVDDSAVFAISGLPSDANGIITVVVGDKSGSAQVSNGAASVSIIMSAEGTYNAEISYSNDDKYMANSKNVQFNVIKITPTMSVSVSNIKVGANAVFKVTGLPTDATGTVNVTVDGKSASASVSNGKATINLEGLTSGSKTATITYLGNYKYNSVDVTKKFTVSKNNPTITVDSNSTAYVGDSAEFKFHLNSDASGTITVILDGKTGTGDVVNGESTIVITSLTEGTKTPQISYSGDEKYNSATVSAQDIVVIKKDPVITVNPIDDIHVGEDLIFDVLLSPDMSGHVTVVYGNDFTETYDAKSKVSVTIPDLSYGTKDIDIIYSGDSKYNPATITVTANVIKNTANITANNIVMSYGDGSAISAKLVDAKGSPIVGVSVRISITIGSNVVSYSRITDSEGIASLPVNLASGNYAFSAAFDGNNKYESALASATLTVNKAVSSLSVNNIVMSYKDGSAISAKLVDAKGSPIVGVSVRISITIGSNVVSYSRITDSEGIASLPVNLASGNYAFSAAFDGNSKYKSASGSATLTVNKAVSSLSVNNIVMSYKDGSAISAKLVDDYGNAIVGVSVRISITIGSNVVSYSRITDSEGIASLPVNLAPGKYAFSAAFDGNSMYKSASGSASLTVNKATPILTSEDLIMFYKDGSAYKVKLTDEKGVPLSDIVIKFTIRSSNYNIKTNSEGIASLPINLLAGTYNISATVSDSKYNPIKVENTITVNSMQDVNIIANDITMVYKDGTDFEVQLVDKNFNPIALAGETIKISLKDKTYNRITDASGIARLPINLVPGSYTLISEYNGQKISNTVVVNKA